MTSQYTVFTLPLVHGSREEEDLNTFIESHRIIQITREIVTVSTPCWSLLVEYEDRRVEGKQSGGPTQIDYKEVLSETDFALFRTLRDLRKGVAESHGVPVYAVFTNQQLADIARTRPTSIAELQKIDGIGQGKSDRYGEIFIGAICGLPDDQSRKPV